MPRTRTPQAPGQFASNTVEDGTDDPPTMSENAARGKLILSAIMDALIGKRIAAKELATRALALGIAGGHWRLDGIPRRQLARRIGVTHAALCRRVSEIRAHFKGKPPTAKSGNAPTRQR